MAGTRRLSELSRSVTARLNLPRGAVVVALSGGADSAALAYLCVSAETEVRGLHVDHGLTHSALMKRAAAGVAGALGLDLEVVAVEVPGGPSPEGQARRARYSAFAAAAGRGGSLLTGHTRDDVVETVVFNLIRGTGPRGLAGIPHHRPPNVVRPMLGVTRSETREIAALAGLPFADDPMNDDPAITRNVLRSRVIPLLAELNPRLDESLARLAAAVAADSDHLDAVAAAIGLLHRDDSVAVPIGELLAVSKAVADRALMRMLDDALGSGGASADRVAGLWSVARGERDGLELASEVNAERRGPLLVIGRRADSAGSRDVTLTPGLHVSGRVEFEVLSHDRVCRSIPLSRWAAVFPHPTDLIVRPDGVVLANGAPAWVPGERRYPVAWYEPGSVGYLSVFAREKTGWTSSH